ncbi:MAG TPA: class I SAM-dependent methyltransferase, partial [Terriglobales bacterium]|nr:class I SAM-dependent methyltransferase [Terriglobales bacterium]
TQPTFFTSSGAALARADERRGAKLVVANNVFAHIDDLHDVVEGVKRLLADDGVFVFEVQYLLDLVEKNLVDMVYHEHLDYHAVRPLVSFFRANGLVLFDAQLVSTHGGSVRCFVGYPGVRSPFASVSHLIAREITASLFTGETYRRLQARFEEACREVREFVTGVSWEALNGGSREPVWAAYGAPAKATTLLRSLGHEVTSRLRYVVDDSQWKQGLLTPASHIEIVAAPRLLAERPDYLLILAWNYAGPIVEKVRTIFRESEHAPPPKMVVPLPRMEIY